MYKELKKIGDLVEDDKDAMRYIFNSTPNEGDAITLLNIGEEIEEKEVIKIEDYDEFDDQRGLFYNYGNDAICGGAAGINGASPFFNKGKNIETKEIKGDGSPGKVGKSRASFIEMYKKEYSDGLMEDLFDAFVEHAEYFQDLETEWFFIDRVNGTKTWKRHRYFLNQFLSKKNKKDTSTIKGKCDVCQKEGTLKDVKLPFATLNKRCHNLYYEGDVLNVSNLPVRICKDCEGAVYLGWNFLYKEFGKRFVLIPQLRKTGKENQLEDFLSIVKDSKGVLSPLIETITNTNLTDDLDFGLYLVDDPDHSDNRTPQLKRYIPNLKVLNLEFEEHLIRGNHLEYFDKELKGDYEISVPELKTFLDLEKVLLTFFPMVQNYPIHQQTTNQRENFHLYDLYYDNNFGNDYLPKSNMIGDFRNLLTELRDPLFSFVYECKFSSLKEETLDRILLTFMEYEIRNMSNTEGNSFSEWMVENKISEGLNYYYFLRSKIYGGKSMREKMDELKALLDELDEKGEKGGEEVWENIRELVKEDDTGYLLHYLVGQLIRLIDNSRGYEGKNKMFDDFVTSVSEKNVHDEFANQVMQNQSYYIEGMNPKGKFVFELISDNLDRLFVDPSYSKSLIAMYSGYFANSRLSSEKGEDE